MPFYLRTGKGMAEGARIVSIAFREPPKSMFPPGSGVGALGPDHLTFDLADAARLSLSFYGKRPGPGMRLDKLSLQFAVQETEHGGDVLEAYERLIHDAMTGDQTLFPNADGIERLWEVSQPLLDAPPPVAAVPARFVGSAGHGRARRPAPLAAAVRARLAPCELSPTTDDGPGRRWTGQSGDRPNAGPANSKGHVIVCGLQGVGLRTVEQLHLSDVRGRRGRRRPRPAAGPGGPGVGGPAHPPERPPRAKG